MHPFMKAETYRIYPLRVDLKRHCGDTKTHRGDRPNFHQGLRHVTEGVTGGGVDAVMICKKACSMN